MNISRILSKTIILTICAGSAVFAQNAPKVDGFYFDSSAAAQINRSVFVKSIPGSFGKISWSLMLGTNKGNALQTDLPSGVMPSAPPKYDSFNFSPASNGLVRDIKFISDSQGYLLKNDGLYFSDGSSMTWKLIIGVNDNALVKPGLISELWGMSFVDERRLCLAGVYLKNTTDRDIDRELLVCTDDITAMKVKWEEEDKPNSRKTEQLQLTNINFDKNRNGWAVGTDGAEGIVWYSKNGGQNWQEEQVTINEPLLGIYGLEKNKAFAVGYNGTIYAKVPVNGGNNNGRATIVINNQTKSNQTENNDADKIEEGDEVSFILTEMPRIGSKVTVIGEVVKIHSENMLEIKVLETNPKSLSGAAKAYLYLNKIPARDVKKTKSKNNKKEDSDKEESNKNTNKDSNKNENNNKKNSAISDANSDAVNKDDDDTEKISAQWKKISVPLASPAPNLRSVKFAENALDGFIVGDKGTILYTQDGGLNWKILPIVQLKSIDFYSMVIDGNYAWIVGSKGAVVRIKFK